MKKNIFKNDILILKILKLPVCARIFIYDILSLCFGFTLYFAPIFNEIFILKIIGAVLIVIGILLLLSIPGFVAYITGECKNLKDGNQCMNCTCNNTNDIDVDD